LRPQPDAPTSCFALGWIDWQRSGCHLSRGPVWVALPLVPVNAVRLDAISQARVGVHILGGFNLLK